MNRKDVIAILAFAFVTILFPIIGAAVGYALALLGFSLQEHLGFWGTMVLLIFGGPLGYFLFTLCITMFLWFLATAWILTALEKFGIVERKEDGRS